MIDGSALSVGNAQAASLLDAQAGRLLASARAENADPGATKDDAKIAKASHDFESILLGSWLQQAEQSFATVPGGDGEDDEAGKDQFQGIAMQALAGSLTKSGGIGIARMISEHLHKASSSEAGQAGPSTESEVKVGSR